MTAIEGIILLSLLFIYLLIFRGLKRFDKYKKKKYNSTEKNEAEEYNLWRTKDDNKQKKQI